MPKNFQLSINFFAICTLTQCVGEMDCWILQVVFALSTFQYFLKRGFENFEHSHDFWV